MKYNNFTWYALVDDSKYNDYVDKSMDDVSFIQGKNGMYLSVQDIGRIIPSLAEYFYYGKQKNLMSGTIYFIAVKWHNGEYTSERLDRSRTSYVSEYLLKKYISGTADEDTRLLLDAILDACYATAAANGAKQSIREEVVAFDVFCNAKYKYVYSISEPDKKPRRRRVKCKKEAVADKAAPVVNEPTVVAEPTVVTATTTDTTELVSVITTLIKQLTNGLDITISIKPKA